MLASRSFARRPRTDRCLSSFLSAPHHFSAEGVAKSASANWAIAQTNLKKIIRSLVGHIILDRASFCFAVTEARRACVVQELHFAEDLNFRAPFDQLDLTAISKEKDLAELIKILELVAVAAIKSPDRCAWAVGPGFRDWSS